jgi:WD40 repeat protein
MLGLAAVATMVPPVLAHHTVANSYDVRHVVTLTGMVTEVEWKNPHVIYHLFVPDTSGRIEEWQVESRHLQGMRSAGIDDATIKIGDRLAMRVLVALDGSHHAATVSMTLADGRTVRVCTVTNDRCP